MSIAFLNLRFEVSDTSELFTYLSYTGKLSRSESEFSLHPGEGWGGGGGGVLR